RPRAHLAPPSFPTRRSSDLVLGHYALAVSECYGTNEGLMVIDLSGLPASATVANVHTNGVVSSHNMDVDEGTGYLYVLDSSGSRSEEHTSELQSRENLVCRL